MKGLRKFFETKDKSTVIYLGMLLALGVLLLFLGKGLIPPPGGGDDALNLFEPAQAVPTATPAPFTQEAEWEKRLEEVFALMDGVGKVRVLLSVTPEQEKEYATDANTTESVTRETDGQGGSRETHSRSSQETTLVLTDKNGAGYPLVLRESAPKVVGAVVIAEGGDNVFVRDALTKAACTVLGLEANKVQVLKMK